MPAFYPEPQPSCPENRVRPITPRFEYRGMRASGKAHVFIISVEISIDQGAGSPSQVGRSAFTMIQSTEGWQVLPDPVAENEAQILPRPKTAE